MIEDEDPSSLQTRQKILKQQPSRTRRLTSHSGLLASRWWVLSSSGLIGQFWLWLEGVARMTRMAAPGKADGAETAAATAAASCLVLGAKQRTENQQRQ